MTLRTPRLYTPGTHHVRSIRQPIATHFRRVTGAELECPHYVMGWTTTIDVTTKRGQELASVARGSGRRFIEEKSGNGIIEFHFFPGQECFHRHKVQNGEPPLFIKVKRDGDIVHQEPQRFAYEMNEEVYRAQKQIKEG